MGEVTSIEMDGVSFPLKSPESALLENPVASTLALIERMAINPAVDADKMGKLVDLQLKVMNRQAEIEFNEAMSRLQPKLPQIKREAKSHNGNYARYEDVDRVVRPLYTNEGFTINFDTKGQTHFGTISHRAGHSKTCQIDFAPDKSGNKNDPQAIISALSYAKRNLLQMLLNIVTTGEDNDGNGAPITDEQAAEIKQGLKDSGLDVGKFLKTLKVESVEEIRTRDLGRAQSAIDAKKYRNLQEKKIA